MDSCVILGISEGSDSLVPRVNRANVTHFLSVKARGRFWRLESYLLRVLRLLRLCLCGRPRLLAGGSQAQLADEMTRYGPPLSLFFLYDFAMNVITSNRALSS